MTSEQRIQSCPVCGSREIVEGARVDQTAEAGNIGLSYRAWGPVRATEAFRADVCRKCGTVVRLFVRKPDRPWITD